MKVQPVLLVSAVLLAGCGVAALFAPQEIASLLNTNGEAASPLVIQLLGAGLFALGLLDWISRFATIGGIYGRPVLLANFAYFFTAAATLFRRASSTGTGRYAWIAAVVCGVLALWYARFLFFPPKRAAE